MIGLISQRNTYKIKKIAKVYVRTFGDKGNSETKSLLERFYKYIFSNKEVISLDSSNNSAPSSTLNKYTKYTKNKNHKSKNILFNYQMSHVFGKTLNCYAFTAPWNVVYLPKVLDPFTGHESKGELTEQFTENYKNLSNQIIENRFVSLIKLWKIWLLRLSNLKKK